MALVLGAGCQPFREASDAGQPDRGVDDGPRDDGLRSDAPATDLPVGTDSQIKPCRSIPLLCLDPSPAEVIEVPTEASAADAFDQAKAGETIQIKGASLGAGWKVPAYATLRGCQGAKIAGDIGFAGSGGVIEGFEVTASIVANLSGAYTIRFNRFSGSTTSHGVSARSVEGLVSASVTALVEGNWFEQRPYGVEARTYYDTGTHQVDITIRNNIFTGVDQPIEINESGLVGKIDAKIEHNTLHDFTTGIYLGGLEQKVVTSGNLLVHGTTAVAGAGNSVYEASFSALWQVDKVGISPIGASFADADPLFVSAGAGDFRPGAGSTVVDAIPTTSPMPGEDYLGCPRPVALKGTAPLGDIGAIELQP